jgi:hypothetical protein
MAYSLDQIDYGFWWGPAKVERIASDPKHGVFPNVSSKGHEVQIRVTPSGLIRVGKPTKKAKVTS